MKKSEAIEEILGPQHLSSPRSNDELEVISELTKYVEKIEGDALDEVVAEQLWWSEKRNRLFLAYLYTSPEKFGTMTKQSEGGPSVLKRSEGHACRMGSLTRIVAAKK